MKGKAALLAGLAAGYVLGTRDGRGRYEQIKTRAQGVWKDPRVQEKATAARDAVQKRVPSGGSGSGAPDVTPSSGTTVTPAPGPTTATPTTGPGGTDD